MYIMGVDCDFSLISNLQHSQIIKITLRNVEITQISSVTLFGILNHLLEACVPQIIWDVLGKHFETLEVLIDSTLECRSVLVADNTLKWNVVVTVY